MTWAPALERLAGLWDDLPTRLSLAGLAVWLAVTTGLMWWTSQHYVRIAATGWRLTTWEKAVKAERTAGQEESGLAPETWDDPRVVS